MEQTQEEVFRVNGDQLLEKVRQIIQEGNVRKIAIRDKNDKTIAEFPLTIGVAGAVLAPMLVAVGAIAALITECSIVVSKQTDA